MDGWMDGWRRQLQDALAHSRVRYWPLSTVPLGIIRAADCAPEAATRRRPRVSADTPPRGLIACAPRATSSHSSLILSCYSPATFLFSLFTRDGVVVACRHQIHPPDAIKGYLCCVLTLLFSPDVDIAYLFFSYSLPAGVGNVADHSVTPSLSSSIRVECWCRDALVHAHR